MDYYLEEIEVIKAQIDEYNKKEDLDKIRKIVKNFNEWNDVKLTYTSNALEGNTFTSLETAEFLEKKTVIADRTLNEHLEIRNHHEAIHYIRENTEIESIDIAFIEKLILTIHRMLLSKVNDNIAGVFRKVPVRIVGSNSIMPNYLKVPVLMQDLYGWIVDNIDKMHPVSLASEAHLKLVSIHPFEDGNGRTARLLMNFILLKFGYPITSIEMTYRIKYLTAIEKVQCGGIKDDYQKIIFQSILQSLLLIIEILDQTMLSIV